MNQENPKRQKVLFIITKGTWGGAQRYVYDLARSLPTSEFQPIVASGTPGKLVDMLSKENIETRSIPSLGRNIIFFDDLQSFFEIYACIREVRPDFVHLNSSKAAALGALAARIARVPRIIFTVHGWPFKEKRNAFAVALIYLVSWLTALFSDIVIVVTRHDVEPGIHMPGINKRIRYVPIGMDPPSFLPKGEAIAALREIIQSESIAETSVLIGTIAELTANKGIRYGIEALADLRKRTDESYVYVVIGEGEEEASLRELAKKRGVDDKVFFAGFISDAGKLLRAFDFFLLPSIKEGMPYVLLEAGESGVFTIATKLANPELLERYENIHFIPPANVIAISDMIRNAKEKHPPLVEERAGRFPLSKMLEDTIAQYSMKSS